MSERRAHTSKGRKREKKNKAQEKQFNVDINQNDSHPQNTEYNEN